MIRSSIKILAISMLIFTITLMGASVDPLEGFSPEIIKEVRANNQQNETVKKLKKASELYPDIKLPKKEDVQKKELQEQVDEVAPYLQELFEDEDGVVTGKVSEKRAKRKSAEEIISSEKSTHIIGSTIVAGSGLSKILSASCVPTKTYMLSSFIAYNKIDTYKGDDVDLSTDEKADQMHIYYIFTTSPFENFEVSISFPYEKWKIDTPRLVPNGDESGLGDVFLRTKYTLASQNSSRDAKIALGLGIKFATGDEDKLAVNGVTGEPDFEIYAAYEQNFKASKVMFNARYVFTGDPTLADGSTLNIDDKFIYGFGVEYTKTPTLTLGLEIYGENWGNYGDKLEVIPSFKTRIRDDLSISCAFPITITNDQEFGYDFQWIGGIEYKF